MSTKTIDRACAPTHSEEELDPHIPKHELPGEDVFTKAFAEVLPIAEAVPSDRIRTMNVHSDLAFVNAKYGYAAVEPHLEEIRALRGVDSRAIERVPLFSLALLGASHRLNLLAPPESELPEKLLRGRRMRKGLLHIAKGAATLGYLPTTPVERITKGSGSLDTARDLIDLSLLFRESEAALRGQLTVCPDTLSEAAELGAWLRNALQPTNALPRPKATAAEIQKATLDRARIWTLLVESYAELQRVAAFLRLDVPSLQSRRAMKKKGKAAE